MKPYLIAELARLDVLSILEYIAKDSPLAAATLADRFYTAFKRIGTMPGLGHLREDLTTDPDLRFFSVGRFLIVYRELPSVIEIARVFGGAQDVRSILPPTSMKFEKS